MLRWIAVPVVASVLIAGRYQPRAEQGAAAQSDKLVTLTNLHYDPAKTVFYSQNMQMPALLPMCTAVTVGARTPDEITFTVDSTKVLYTYELRSKATPEGLDSNFARYFGPACDSAAVRALSDLDRRGIKTGQALVGMTKQGVIFAIGYPPKSHTPSTDGNAWRYWHSRFDTFLVYFDADTVLRIKE